jgi:Protein of unknown function (DUF2442)
MRKISADTIAAKASRGEDVSEDFTNKFKVAGPVRRVKAISARYDPKARRIVIHLSSKLIVSFSPRDVEGLETARASQLQEIEISPSGFGIHFPALDADFYVPALLAGTLGSKAWTRSK